MDDDDIDLRLPPEIDTTILPDIGRSKNFTHELNRRSPPRESEHLDGMGIDEEVIVKKRRIQAKLDHDRIVSGNGLPRLLRDSRKKVHFQGKGNELSDLDKLVQYYQIWAHRLYPRARFRDFIAMIEKEGHRRRMQSVRRQYIDETKPKRYMESTEDLNVATRAAPQAETRNVKDDQRGQALFIVDEDNANQEFQKAFESTGAVPLHDEVPSDQSPMEPSVDDELDILAEMEHPW